MSEQQQDHFLSSTPVNVAVDALQRQVDQLKRIINKSGTKKSQHIVLKNFLIMKHSF